MNLSFSPLSSPRWSGYATPACVAPPLPRWSGLLVARTRAARRTRFLSPVILAIAILLTLPLAARADDGHPDFKHDAKPLLAHQPGLVTFVKQHFDVEETGYSRAPGNPPAPPYIFRAKPHGAPGDDTITLLIEDGPPGKILKVKNTGPFHPGAAPFNPSGQPAGSPDEQTAPHIAATNDKPPGASTTPVADGFVGVSSSTPSGPIKSTGSSSNDPQQPLAPPADPAPAH